jgi:hypothetical protein
MENGRPLFRRLLTSMGGRHWVLVSVFVFLAIWLATVLLAYHPEFGPDHWLSALDTCKWIIAILVSKRIAEEVSRAFGKNGKADP